MKLKQALAVLLCAVLLAAGAALPAGAAETCGCGEVLQVFVDGFGGNALYYNQGTSRQKEVGVAKLEGLVGAISKALGWLALAPVSQGGESVANGIGSLLGGLMGHLRMDEQGKSLEPITANWAIDKKQNHTKEPEYKYEYDWRGDPFDAAKGLHDFIEALCEHTGHKKIALTGFSAGSSVVLSYLKLYGSARLDTLLILNGAWQGLQMVGELLNGQVALTGTSVTNYIANYDGGSGILRGSMGLVDRLGLLDFAGPLVRGLVTTGDQALYDELISMFGTMPIIWAFTPDAYYAGARKALEGNAKYEALLKKIDKYHYEIQAKAQQLLQKARRNGVKIGVICGYGHAPIPATVSQDYHTDTLIDTANASGGATVAPFGQTLPGSGTAKYRSPDGIVDASTCMFPEYTWFIKGCKHEIKPSKALREWIISSGKQPDIHSNPEFPQYMKVK